MILYKLTTQDFKTREGYPNETLWGRGVSHTAKGHGTELCSDGYIHAYLSPLLAVLMNPIHAGIQNPVVWEAEGSVSVSDGLKVGCKTLTTVRQIPLPSVTTEQRVRFAILCALAVSKDEAFKIWAGGWLSGSDTSEKAASAAARGAASVAAATSPASAAEAARAAGWAAEEAARAAGWAAEEAARAACAAWAASAADSEVTFDPVETAKEAMK